MLSQFALWQDELDQISATDNWGVEVADVLVQRGQAGGFSDIHISFQRQRLIIRGRKNGTLIPLGSTNPGQGDLLVARLKVMASLPTFKKQSPQDGRIPLCENSGALSQYLRISFLPTIHGENVVIRFPDSPDNRGLGFDELGMSDSLRAAVVSLMTRREGTVFVTGPGSSGKTTTLYAMLNYLNESQGERLNILTIEDPVERDLDFAGQVQVNNLQDLSFAQSLRSVLRQDPNVIMIGEVRDNETACIALQAGMSGHLVLSTLHAGRAFRVYGRLLSMNTDPYLVASAVSGSIGQRLVRLACPSCAGDGCGQCEGSGSQKRTGLFEVCIADENLREMTLSKTPPDKIADYAFSIQTGNIMQDAENYYHSKLITRDEWVFLTAGEDLYEQSI